MIYTLKNGRDIDTERELDFEQRNFVQKMMIYQHLDMDPEEFHRRWQGGENPVWQGPAGLDPPSPAALILMDLEEKLKRKKQG